MADAMTELEKQRALAIADANLKLMQQEQAPVAEGPPELTAGRAAGMVTRGMVPPAAGAALGAGIGMLGGPAAPITVPLGALAGSLAVPAADLLAGGMRAAGMDVGYPSELVQRSLTALGLPEPQTTTERALVAGGGAVGGAGGQLGAVSQLARTATSQTGRNIAQTMAQQPGRQMLAAAPAGAAAQVVGESTENPLLGMLAGATVGAPFMAFGGPKGSVPTSDKLKSEAAALYRKSAAQGAMIKPSSLNQAGLDILQKVSNKVVIDPQVDTEAMAVIRRLQNTAYAPQSLEELDLTRQFLASAKASGGRSGKFAGEALALFDDYIDNLTINDLSSTKKPGVAIKALENARAGYAKAKKIETLEDLLTSAELRGEVNYTQAGVEQGIRQKTRALVENPKQMRYFTKGEQEMLRSVAKGGPINNMLRWVGKVSPSSIVGLGAGTYVVGSSLGPAAAAAVPIIGAGAKAASEALLRNRYENAMRTIAGQPTVNPMVGPMVGATRGALSAPPLGLLFPYGE
jgi:hypothetical protein